MSDKHYNNASRIVVFLGCFLLLIFFGCTPRYKQEIIEKSKTSCIEYPFFLVILVDAPHLDYSCNRTLCRTIAKHPSNGSKSGDVGHAWICLQGCLDGKQIVIEGGHSGERGVLQAKYFDGIMNNIQYGHANPTDREISCPQYEPNPIRYLWEIQKDGFFQKGNGGHRPTYAVKIFLTESQCRNILWHIDPRRYCYEEYSLTSHQCTTFVAEVAELAGLKLDCEMNLPIGQFLRFNNETFMLWNDPEYSVLAFASPDILECSLKEAVAEGKAEYALQWYQDNFPNKIDNVFETIIRFPGRLYRYMCF